MGTRIPAAAILVILLVLLTHAGAFGIAWVVVEWRAASEGQLEATQSSLEALRGDLADAREELGARISKLEMQVYIQQVELLINTIDDRSSAQIVVEPAQAFTLWALVLDFTAKDLREIDPPALVARDHRDLADAFSEGAQRMKDLSELYPVVETLEEAERLINDDETLTAIDHRAQEACSKIQESSRDYGIEIELELCQDGSS